MNLTWWDKVTMRDRVYVIAELGSNYLSREHLFGAINLAKNMGAQAIKYQYFTRDELYGPTYKLDEDFPLAQLKEKCDAAGIDFLCTAFSPEGLARVDQYVDAHKIASSEMSHIRMLDMAKAMKKPVIMSTGGQHLEDIKYARAYLGMSEMIVMHCNLKYPAKFVDLEKFQAIKDYFRCPIGFSDHTTSIDVVPYLMSQQGVRVYEKHFNPYDLTTTPDAPHSLNTNEFKQMLSVLRGERVAVIDETEARTMHMRRVIATKPIQIGDELKEGQNIGIFRVKKPDVNGLSPFAISKLEGKKATRAFDIGDGVSSRDVD